MILPSCMQDSGAQIVVDGMVKALTRLPEGSTSRGRPAAMGDAGAHPGGNLRG